MEPLLEFLNDEAWWGFRSSSFGEERAPRIACGGERHQLSHGGSRPKREARKSTNARTLADRWRLCG